MQSESWLSWWSTWKSSGIMCWIGVIVLFFEFRNQGIMALTLGLASANSLELKEIRKQFTKGEDRIS